MEHTSKELSQRLHDKGFRAEHVWAWATQDDVFSDIKKGDMVAKGVSKCATVPAYTFTELFSAIPGIISGDEHEGDCELNIYKQGNSGPMVAIYWDETGGQYSKECIHESPTEALGLLVEWLIDNGHIVSDLIGGKKG